MIFYVTKAVFLFICTLECSLLLPLKTREAMHEQCNDAAIAWCKYVFLFNNLFARGWVITLRAKSRSRFLWHLNSILLKLQYCYRHSISRAIPRKSRRFAKRQKMQSKWPHFTKSGDRRSNFCHQRTRTSAAFTIIWVHTTNIHCCLATQHNNIIYSHLSIWWCPKKSL